MKLKKKQIALVVVTVLLYSIFLVYMNFYRVNEVKLPTPIPRETITPAPTEAPPLLKLKLGSSISSFENNYGKNYNIIGEHIYFKDIPLFVTVEKEKVTSITYNYENDPFDLTSQEVLQDMKHFLPEDAKPVNLFDSIDNGKEVKIDTTYYYKSLKYSKGFNVGARSNINIVINFNSNGVYLATISELIF